MRRLDLIERRPIRVRDGAHHTAESLDVIEATLSVDPAGRRASAAIDERFAAAPHHPFLDELRRVAKQAVLVEVGRGRGRRR